MKYIIKKVSIYLFTFMIVSLLAFLSFTLISGDIATSKLGINATVESVELLREQLGLNRPILIQYWDWLFSFLQGDLGTSYSYNMPVGELVFDKLPITLTMTLMSFAMILLISIPSSLYMIKHKGNALSKGFYLINHISMSMPPFFVGIIITLLFGFVFVLFMPGNYISYKEDFLGYLRYLVFPSLAIAIPKAAMTTKLLYSALEKEKKMDYVRTAYSRGNKTGVVINQHMLKNAMIPLITFLGMTVTDIMIGSVIIEQVFSVPGIGRILITSIFNRDVPVVLAIIMLMATVVILVNGVVDILYHIVDPRIEVE